MTSQGEVSSGSVAAISTRPSEAGAESESSSSRKHWEQEAQEVHKKMPTKDATAKPLLAAEQHQHLQLPSSELLPADAGRRLPIVLSTVQWRWLVSFCTFIGAGIVVIIVLQVLQMHRSNSVHHSSMSTNGAAVTLPPDAATRLPADATAEPPIEVRSIGSSKTLRFALNKSALPECLPNQPAAQQERRACFKNQWIFLHGSGELPIGPFTCSSKTPAVCQQVVTQSAENHLQAVLPGIYKIRAQVTLQCNSSDNQQQQKQPIILVLYAPNDNYQNDNHQVCQTDKVQTLHTAAIVDLRAGDTVSLKLLFPTTLHPVEVKVLAMRASSQMTWEVQTEMEF